VDNKMYNSSKCVILNLIKVVFILYSITCFIMYVLCLFYFSGIRHCHFKNLFNVLSITCTVNYLSHPKGTWRKYSSQEILFKMKKITSDSSSQRYFAINNIFIVLYFLIFMLVIIICQE
jgi:hypothetical protein